MRLQGSSQKNQGELVTPLTLPPKQRGRGRGTKISFRRDTARTHSLNKMSIWNLDKLYTYRVAEGGSEIERETS